MNGTLTTSTGTLTILSGTSAYADIAANTSANPTTLYPHLRVAAHVCGTPLDFSLSATYSGGLSVRRPSPSSTGSPALDPSVNYASTDVPKAIPDNTRGHHIGSYHRGATGPIGTLVVHLNATHTWDSDLSFTLIAPDGTRRTLISRSWRECYELHRVPCSTTVRRLRFLGGSAIHRHLPARTAALRPQGETDQRGMAIECSGSCGR